MDQEEVGAEELARGQYARGGGARNRKLRALGSPASLAARTLPMAFGAIAITLLRIVAKFDPLGMAPGTGCIGEIVARRAL